MSGSNSITFLNLKKHQGIVFKNGNDAIILTDINPNDKIYQYSIQPYLDSCQVSHAAGYNLSANINTAYLEKKYGLIQFLNKRIFIFDRLLQNNMPLQKLKTDYIYLTGNQDTGLSNINSNFNYQILVIDGNNTDTSISRIEKAAKSKRIAYKILKRNNSLISISN